MRSLFLLTIAAFLTSALVVPTRAQAQGAFSSSKGQTLATLGNRPHPLSAPAPGALDPDGMMVLSGKITNPSGPLPGAVIILKSTRQMAVTNADGEFELVVPASAGALQAVVTYAGYADEPMLLNAADNGSTVSLTNAKVVVVSRRQQLKAYLKTAHKQVKRDLRKLHKK
ncbi:MAG: hypothetical protein NVS3B25_08370 [Hymenobacter sp.]